MPYISKIDRRLEREKYQAALNRREIIAAGFSRREMLKMGLLTAAGLLIPRSGLSARTLNSAGSLRAGQSASPPVTPFVQDFVRFTIKQPVSPSQLSGPPPQIEANRAINPATGLPFEGRTVAHQAVTEFPPAKYYEVTQKLAPTRVHPELPVQPLWGFDGLVPGPLYVARYGEPIFIRNHNALPIENDGFGKNETSTHLHNGHTPSESDGFPCYFFESGQYYDQHYPNVYAGVKSTHKDVGGDINEAMSTLWYHDHMLDYTSQNVYKGLAGMYNIFNEFDSGNETTGFRLPTFPDYDINMLFSDQVYDAQNGIIAFDTFNLDGILGDHFLVNGLIQPVLHVSPRRYRFRWLDAGPSRFYQFFLTDLDNLGAHNRFYQISTDGNLLPNPVQVESVRLGVAERVDVIVDFSKYAGKTLYIENRLEQTDGRGPTGVVLAPGQGNLILKIVVDGPAVPDHSVDPATLPRFYDLPDKTVTPRIIRNFNFERNNGQWAINGKFMDCDDVRVHVKQDTVEQWNITNNSGGWQHPAHIHFEEFQFLSINGATPPLVLGGRKDVVRLEENMQTKCLFRFRDFHGKYPFHCHNVVHEDHAMMLIWEIGPDGDDNTQP
jgi:FtsP/CotA-like multicopper oxidase with cupredoxin domain